MRLLNPAPHAAVLAAAEAAHTTAKRIKPTHCKHGHEYTPENTYFPPNDRGRKCRTCNRLAVTPNKKTPLTNEERFWKYVTKTEGCWLWHGYSIGGYGTLSINNRPVRAHRFSFALHNGPIADGLFVCHRCDTPKCVNPSHLFLGSPLDNVLDMYAKGRQPKNQNEAKTHCIRGHAFDTENTLVRTKKGHLGRACKMCNQAHHRASKAKKRLRLSTIHN